MSGGTTDEQMEQWTARHKAIQQDILTTHTDTTWQPHSTVDGVTIHTKPVAGSPMVASRGVSVVKQPMEIVDALLKLWEFKPLLDQYYQSHITYDTQYTSDTITEINYQLAASPSSWVAQRDTLYRSQTVYTNEQIISTSFSIDYPAHKSNPAYVRAILISGAFLLQPLHNADTGATNTKVTSITAVNPGGSIPGFLLNTAITAQPLMAARINTLLSTNTKVLQRCKAYAAELQQRRNGTYVNPQQQIAAASPTSSADATYNTDVPAPFVAALDKAHLSATNALLLNTSDNNAWEHKGLDNGVDVHTKNVPNTIYCRGLYYIDDFTLDELVAFYTDYSTRHTWDFMLATAGSIRQYNPDCTVGYIRFQPPPWPLSARDACLIGRLQRIDNTTPVLRSLDKTVYGDGAGYWLTATSIQHEQCPTASSHVRATIDFATLYLRTFTGTNRIAVVTASSTNPQGSMSLPSKLIQGISAKSPLILLAMHSYMRKHRPAVQTSLQRFNKLQGGGGVSNTTDTSSDDTLCAHESEWLQHLTGVKKHITHVWKDSLPYDVTEYNRTSTLQRAVKAYRALRSQSLSQCGVLYVRTLQYTLPHHAVKQVDNNVLIRLSVISELTTLTPIAEYQNVVKRPAAQPQNGHVQQDTFELTAEQREQSHLVCPILDVNAVIQIDAYVNDLASPFTTYRVVLKSLLSDKHKQNAQLRRYNNGLTHSSITLHTYTSTSHTQMYANKLIGAVIQPAQQHTNIAVQFVNDVQRLCCMWLVLMFAKPLFVLLLFSPALLTVAAPTYSTLISLCMPLAVVVLSYTHVTQKSTATSNKSISR